MLKRLKISNFALVEDIELSFDAGMSVLSGETGAGKSVIVTALSMALGERADREQIRHGANKATVEAQFSVAQLPRQYRDEHAAHLIDDTFTVCREVTSSGNSKVRINDTIVTLAQVRQMAAPLAEILGQHSNRLLLDEDNHLLFLDRFASVDEQRERVGTLFVRWEQARSELKRTCAQRDALEQERELLLFQQKEIETAEVRVGEEDELNQERRILDASRTLIEAAAKIEQLLGGEEASAVEILRAARKEFDHMATIDTTLEPQAKQLADIDYQVEDLRAFIEKYGSSVPDDPHRLEEINHRLDELYQLKQKYGGSEASVIETLQDITTKLHDRPDTSVLITRLESEEAAARTAYSEKALQLSEVRRKAAKYLQKLVVKEMTELAIDKGQFDSEFVYVEDNDGVEVRGQTVRPHAYGLESCRFLFSANPGEPLKSLVKTASGGEISRLLLALKAAEKKSNRRSHSLLVFDEIDAGIGGQTAIEVGRKIKRLSENAQVLVITHLHQIARMADHHYLVEKSEGSDKRVTIRVTRLTATTIAAELERMVALPDQTSLD